MKSNYETLVDVVIKAEVAGTPRHEIVLELGETPAVLLGVGFAAHKLAIKAKTVGKIFFDHGLTQGQIERLPAMLAAPSAIFKSASRPNDSVVVMTLEMKGTAPIIVTVASNEAVGRGAPVNLVTSMYGKEGPDPSVKWTADGLLLWTR